VHGAWCTRNDPAKEAGVSLVEKVKQQAEHAVGLAQQGVTQGQAKFDQMQAKRQSQTLFRRLGEAYYAQQREGGSSEAVTAALVALDEYVAAQSAKDAETPAADGVNADAGPADGAGAVGSASGDTPASSTP
jgi:hypothetical protein